MTVGYFIPSQADAIRVKFLKRFEGYIWSFPRADHLSVGICGSMARHTMPELRHLLEQFLTDEGISAKNGSLYSHVLPSPQLQTLRERRLAGPNWALAGDAAALVDPITGEGLYYALRSGDLLGRDARSLGRRRDIPNACAPISPWISSLARAWRGTCMPAASWAERSPRAWCSSSVEARHSVP